MKTKVNKILLSGEGGQGIQVMAKILADIFIALDYSVSYIPEFGPEQRGTPSVAFLQYSEEPITFPRFEKADILVVMRKRALAHIEKYISPETIIIFDSSTISRRAINQSNDRVFAFPVTKYASENFKPAVQNILMTALLASNIFDLDKNQTWQIVKKQLGKKFKANPAIEELNRKAFDFGFRSNLENVHYSKAEFDVSGKIVVAKGNQKEAVIIPKLCKGCGICIYKCPVGALKFSETLGVYGTPVPEIDLEKCIACGNCFRFCPDSAIKVEKTK